MTKNLHALTRPRNPSRAAESTSPVACLDCARARRQGRPWGCAVHVAEDVL